MEAWKRHRADKRKIHVARYLLAKECEQNLWVMKSIHSALSSAQTAISYDRPDNFRIVDRASGAKHWAWLYPNGELAGGGILYPVRRAILDSTIQTIAELDPRLFAVLEDGINAINELNHLRDSLINYAMDPDETDNKFFDGFVEYAIRELHKIYHGIDKLNRACTGKRLINSRVR